jgi:uncharacterized protein YjbI with pentapeptide repeats
LGELTLEDEDLRGRDFSRADLDAINLVNCDLRGCKFTEAFFSRLVKKSAVRPWSDGGFRVS